MCVCAWGGGEKIPSKITETVRRGPAKERLLKFYRRLDQALASTRWLESTHTNRLHVLYTSCCLISLFDSLVRWLPVKVLKILENKSYRKYYQNLLPSAQYKLFDGQLALYDCMSFS